MTDPASLSFRYVGYFVHDVPATVAFYDTAFGFRLRYMHPSQGYAELESGETLLCFLGEKFIDETRLFGSLPTAAHRMESVPVAAQVAFVTRRLEADWKRAISAGAVVVKSPEAKPWGQTVGYLRDINGIIVELCTPSPRD